MSIKVKSLSDHLERFDVFCTLKWLEPIPKEIEVNFNKASVHLARCYYDCLKMNPCSPSYVENPQIHIDGFMGQRAR